MIAAVCDMNRIKRKNAFEHAQNDQIQINAHVQSVIRGFALHLYILLDSVSGQWRPWSMCMDAQADLRFRNPDMPEETFRNRKL